MLSSEPCGKGQHSDSSHAKLPDVATAACREMLLVAGGGGGGGT